MDFGSPPTSSSSDGPSESQIVSQIQGEVQLAMMQEYISSVRDTCFEKCVTKPSTSLSSSEQQCLARCTDRYGEAGQQHLSTFDLSMQNLLGQASMRHLHLPYYDTT
ncbi:hypothetical protein ABBQ32_010232 [Trebouxia sp. C0010 RCD-2024]